jgi:hypothetical protein
MCLNIVLQSGISGKPIDVLGAFVSKDERAHLR